MVGKNIDGQVIAWRRRRVPYIQNPEVAKALAARQAVQLAMDRGFIRIHIEGDCVSVIRVLQSTYTSYTVFGHILDDIRHYGLSFDSVLFSYIPRHCNTLAHDLSQHIIHECEGESLL